MTGDTKQDWSRADAMPTLARTAAAESDPDAQPLSQDDFARMQRRPRAFVIRRALGLTQKDFADQFRIPIGTLRDWEQGISKPDAASQAYLKVIAKSPQAVRDALAA
ncbi:MAG: helix-turn-helix domain-containing protein [Pseudomonadota bacterium]